MSTQRLVVCLDGTWNRQDSSTNVLHHYHLVTEGPANGLEQKKYYQPGVGTGPLDSITGGGFGLGLEDHVRDAYNWLVGNYHEGDEIFIFGFSRGAFTARSLVGFIGSCGLLRRGAPITVSQLWQYYCILGRDREERDPLRSDPQDMIRKITDLLVDPWLIPKEIPSGPDWVRGKRNEPKTDRDSEQLLVRWSRRVQITFLGIYDTVGAIGWDALAFPVLKSKMATHHNLRPTTLIQKCCHALAIQEHRSSFNHTPFMAYMGHADNRAELERAQIVETGDYWSATRKMWAEKVEQRWFVGAHSNIGGGYESNRLAAKPFEWMFQSAAAAGLGSEEFAEQALSNALPLPRDSYAEFAPPLWAMILRAKRNYRMIAPDPDFKAGRPSAQKAAAHATAPSGFALESINETVDDSVLEYFGAPERPVPPNLYAYAQKLSGWKDLTAKPPQHLWFGDRWLEPAVMAVWSALAAVGAIAIYKLITGIGGDPPEPITWLALGIAFAAPIIDWVESLVNFRLALGRRSPWRLAVADTVYWTRCFGVIFVFFGAVHFVFHFLESGWTNSIADALTAEKNSHWLLPVLAVAGVIVANLLNLAFNLAAGAMDALKRFLKLLWPTTLALGGALVFSPLAALALILASFWIHALFPGLPLGMASSKEALPEESTRAALMLLLEFGLFYFVRAFYWVGEPLGKANLGSEFDLQTCVFPGQVTKCLSTWRQKLLPAEQPEDAKNDPYTERVHALLREALWRDMLGFIPVYTLFAAFGLWFAANELHWAILTPPYYVDFSSLAFNSSWPFAHLLFAMPFWFLPAIAAAADYIEDGCHLLYLRGARFLAPLSFVMTIIKLLAFSVQVILTIGAILDGTRVVAQDKLKAGWSGTAAVLVFGLIAIAVVLWICKRAQQQIAAWQRSRSRAAAAGPVTVV